MTPGEWRDHIWTTLMKERAVSYPLPCFGHHPNFKGSSKAARLLLELLLAQGKVKVGQTVLCYPDYVLKGLRKGLLEAGLNIVVPSQYGSDFRFLESGRVDPIKASSIAGAEKTGRKVAALPEIHFAFVACVAVTQGGQVLDKGYGFHLPNLHLPCATIVHPMQIIEENSLTGLKVDVFATPDMVFEM